jgi:coenzyme PQQ biosynthesis protein PqqD
MTADSRPRLAPRARVRLDRLSGRKLLLYPERGLALGATAAEVVALLDGQRTVAAIVDTVAAAHSAAPRAVVERDVLAFLEALAARALLRFDAPC